MHERSISAMMKHFISINDHSAEELISILQLAAIIKKNPTQFAHALDGKILGYLFFESSTRTALSFQSAMQRLGGSTLGFSTKIGTSSDKGESLTDTIHMTSAYADVLVLRHNLRGSGVLAAEIASKNNVPVINAGSGSQAHPSQALLDVFTIWETQNRLNDLVIGISGDLRLSRTVPALLQIFNILITAHAEIHLFAHDLLRLPLQLRFETSKEEKLTLIDKPSLNDDIQNLDVLYFTRIQRERFPDESMYNDVRGAFIFVESYLQKVKHNFVLLHPLPRVDEIPYSVDSSNHVKYFEQAKNGVFVRMSLLLHLLRPDLVNKITLPKTLGSFPV